MLRVLFIIAVILLVFAGPIAALRQPWAVRLTRRLKVFLLVYVVVIVLVAVIRLVFNWSDIYG